MKIKHLALNKNIQFGTVSFNSVKQCSIVFPMIFRTIPAITFSQNDTSSNVPYKLSVTKSGFIIKLQNNWTGSIDWTAIEK